MTKIVQVMATATGGWGFHFGVTEEQAHQILNLRIGESLTLNQPGEQIELFPDNLIGHCMIWRPDSETPGFTTEDLDGESVFSAVRELISDRAWAQSA